MSKRASAVENAYRSALLLRQNNPRCSHADLQKFAESILFFGDPRYLYLWGHNIGTHLDEMAQALVESDDVHYMARWCATIQLSSPHHTPFKLRALELDEANKFINVMIASSRAIFYSTNDFYDNLPLEARIGVCV